MNEREEEAGAGVWREWGAFFCAGVAGVASDADDSNDDDEEEEEEEEMEGAGGEKVREEEVEWERRIFLRAEGSTRPVLLAIDRIGAWCDVLRCGVDPASLAAGGVTNSWSLSL